jgi:hypothetical protein
MVNVEQSVQWELAGETEVLGEKLPQCHFVRHKSHMICLGSNSSRRDGKLVRPELKHFLAHFLKKILYPICSKQELWSQKNSILLGNASTQQWNCDEKGCTRTAVVMEQLSKHVSAGANTRNTRRAMFSMRSVPRGYRNDKEERLIQLSFETPGCQNMSLGAEKLNWGIRIIECSSVELVGWLWREDLACNFKTSCMLQLQWDCYKSVARIRLVKTEDTYMRVTVNCKICRSVIALYCLWLSVVPSGVYKVVNKSNSSNPYPV